MSIQSPVDLFFDQLRDIHSVELQVGKTLPDLAGWATDSELQELLTHHHKESVEHLAAVREIFQAHAAEPGNDESKAMSGLIEGGNDHIMQTRNVQIRDRILIAHCNRIAHYEIAAYEIATALAHHLELAEAHAGLGDNLKQERAFQRELTRIAHRFNLLFGSDTEANSDASD